MILVSLLACEEPPMLEAVSAELAAEAVDGGGPGLRMMTAMTGILAEACTADDVAGYTFTGPSAVAIGADTPVISGNTDGTVTWMFAEVGVDGDQGVLEVTTDKDMAQVAVSWNGSVGIFGAGLEVADCEGASRTLVTGTGSWQANGTYSTLNLIGEAPDVGVVWEPSVAAAPSGGKLKAESERGGWAIALSDAGEIDTEAGTWPGTASGTGWEHVVAVELP